MTEMYHLESIRVAATLLAFEAIDLSDAEDYLRHLVLEIDNEALKEDPFRVEFLGAELRLNPWVDEKSIQQMFKGDFVVPCRDYEMTSAFNRRRIDDANSLIRLAPSAEILGSNWANGRLGLAMEVFRQNAKAYDGKPFFHDTHKHLDLKTTFSNRLQVNWADPARPTLAELAEGLRSAVTRLLKNRGVQKQVVSSKKLRENLVILANSYEVQEQLELLNDTERIDGSFNPHYRKYDDIWVDPLSPQPFSFIVIYSEGGSNVARERVSSENPTIRGLRPVLFVVKEEPKSVILGQVDMTKKMVPYGLEGAYGVKAGLPQVAVLVEHVDGG